MKMAMIEFTRGYPDRFAAEARKSCERSRFQKTDKALVALILTRDKGE
ncbi:hypothetical protein ACFLT9_05005 [Acidobacteriota bacterium]